MKPMLARTVGPKFNSYPCFVQPKLNGVRALYQQKCATLDGFGIFQSRDEKIWGREVLMHLHNEFSALDLGDLILDGELYKHGWRLQQINGAVAVNRLQPREDTKDVEFHVFDVVDPRNTFSDRFLPVVRTIKEANLPHIKMVPTAYANSWEMVEQFFHYWTKEGYEGIMLRPAGGYEFGEHLGRNSTMTAYRSKTLWKHKSWEDDEFYCWGYAQGTGKAEIGVGALKLQTETGAQFAVGTGFTDQDRIEFFQCPPVGKMVRVRYLCLTEDGIPFNPSFIAVM